MYLLNLIGIGVIACICGAVLSTVVGNSTNPVGYTPQPVRVCYSQFDVYKTENYEITEDNLTLITGHGRVYHLDECRLAEETE